MSGLVLSLFPGLGLLDMAFEAEGFCVVRGPDVLWGGDVRTFHPSAGRFEGVIGGPPCQTFSSLAYFARAQGRETRFGNLIPEFERCIAEGQPSWFLMENVLAAPVPVVAGYAVSDFAICNSHIAGEDGFGQEQMRKRRFSFGVRGESAPDLRKWIRPAALLLPDPHPPVTGAHDETGHKGVSERIARARQRCVKADQGTYLGPGGSRERQPAVTGKQAGTGTLYPAHGGRGERRTLAEMCRLQGLPEDFLADAPFTVDGKRKAVANGVPLPMGRAVAKAVLEALR